MRQDNMADPTKCEKCGSTDLTPPRDYQLMMGLSVGAVADGEINAYLRPETATTTYANFRNVLDSSGRKLPFGLAQIGKAFRNEIAPRNFVFRTREFEQAEMQFFINPRDDEKYFAEWRAARMDWWVNALGVPAKSLRFKPHEKLAHYAKAAVDIEYNFPDGFDEVEGIHNRQDFDLGSHTKSQDEFKIQAATLKNTDSTTKLNYADAQAGENFIPFVIETAMGVNRAMMAVLHNAYTEEDLGDGNSRVVLKMKPSLSPIKAAVIPLARNVPELLEIAEKIAADLRALNIGRIVIENSGNIGKNYRRHDEIGTPVCITIDHQTLEDGTITLRDRDTMAQTRAAAGDVPQKLKEAIFLS
jgi:glycyl-tRNA synthetase